MASRAGADRPPSDTATVSAVVGHELKNIALPLRGYIDLATEEGSLSDHTHKYFAELNAGIERIKALAHDLECLANEKSILESVPLQVCVQQAQWYCDPATSVMVDAYHARAAIEAMARLVATSKLQQPAAVITIKRHAPDLSSCAVCGKTLPGTDGFVRVAAPESRLSRVDAIREMVSPGHPDLSVRRLTLAVMVHCAHHAGGHVIIDQRAGLIGLTFPTC